jgi:hypothetical protein
MASFTRGPHVVAVLDPPPLNWEVRAADGTRWVCRCNRKADADLHAASTELYESVRELLREHGDKCPVCHRARQALTKALGG